MANRFKQFGQWLGEKRPFRMDWFAKDPQQQLVPEEALFNMPEPLSEKLIAAANGLPIPPKAKQVVVDEVRTAIDNWQLRPHVSANSLVIMADPVSAVSQLLAGSLSDFQEARAQASLDVTILDWAERPAQVDTLEAQIKASLDLSEEALLGEDGLRADELRKSGLPAEATSERRHLMLIPNLSWCFLRSADGLDGLDYLQSLLPRDRSQFWVIGSGIVGWEYLKCTLKFHAYCGKTVHLPSLSGEDLQAWLTPLIEDFDIRFSGAALHQRLPSPKKLLDIDFDRHKPIEALSEITQEVSASVQSSVRSLTDEMRQDETPSPEDTPKRDFFERLADISDGVSEVALQLFIRSLRYCEVDSDNTKTTANGECDESILKPVFAPDSKKAQRADNQRAQADSSKEDIQKTDPQTEHQLIATMPKLPLLPTLSQSDLYLLYSLMLHGDMTVKALANSLGDAPTVVTSQVQMLRNQGIIEQRQRVLKINPVHYPKVRRELARNNFIIDIP